MGGALYAPGRPILEHPAPASRSTQDSYVSRAARSQYKSDATTWAHASELIYGINELTGCFCYLPVAEFWPRQWQDKCSQAYRNHHREHANRPEAGWGTPSPCRES